MSTTAGFEPKGATPQASPRNTAAQSSGTKESNVSSLTPTSLPQAQPSPQPAVTLSHATQTSTSPDAASVSQHNAQPSGATATPATATREQSFSRLPHNAVSMQSDADLHNAAETQASALAPAYAAEQATADSTVGDAVSTSASTPWTSRPPGKSPWADSTGPRVKSTRAGLTAPGSKRPGAALAAPEGVTGPWSIKAASGRLTAADDVTHEGRYLMPPSLCLVYLLTPQHLQTQHCVMLLCNTAT